MVVNQAAKLRFIYTGPSATTKEPFYPIGITTDSQSRILKADYNNCSFHLVNQDNYFCFIDNLHIQRPFGLCMDTRDKIYVVEYLIGKVKKIQCYKWKNCFHNSFVNNMTIYQMIACYFSLIYMYAIWYILCVEQIWYIKCDIKWQL